MITALIPVINQLLNVVINLYTEVMKAKEMSKADLESKLAEIEKIRKKLESLK